MDNELKKHILFIDDDPIDRLAFKRFAQNEDFPYSFQIGGSVKESLEFIKVENFDTIISDFNLGDGNALEIIKNTEIPIIIITGIGDGETAVKAMKAGAYDFLLKDNSGDYLKTLPITIENAIKHHKAEKELIEYREHLEEIVKQRTLELQAEIEERKKTEIELLAATKKAKESDRLKSAFLANMSHEIRTPMNAILGFSSLLDNENLDIKDRKSYTSIIQKNSSQLLSIISDVIDISKIESDQLIINKGRCNINKLLKELHLQFSEQIKELKKENLSISYQVNLNDEACFIDTDEVRLKQILSNLLSNAIKFTPQGEISFGYSFRGQKHLLFFVEDTGIGIKENIIPIIFQQFRQSEETNTRYYGGTGLGLTISKGLVKLLGGNIGVDSVVGIGSTFYFTIPYISSNEKNEENKNEENKEVINVKYKNDQQDLDLSEKTFLVVDDRDDVLKYVEILLESTKVNLLFATNGLDAVSIYTENQDKIDLILMDIQLPGIDGLEAVKRIKKINADIAIIVQTAFSFSEDREKFAEIGCKEYITKPINKTLLLNKIKKLLNY